MSASAEELRYFDAALDEARMGHAVGGIPIGAVLARGSEIIGRGHNQRVQQDDPILHGEMACLHNAGRQRTYRDTTLFTTLSPCMMCAGTVIQFGIPRVIVGESRNFKGFQDVLRLAGVEVVDLDDARCIGLMADFIAANPALWNEDIAE